VGARLEYLDGTDVALTALADGRRAPAPILTGTATAIRELRTHLRLRA
jgi:hypothetical protein